MVVAHPATAFSGFHELGVFLSDDRTPSGVKRQAGHPIEPDIVASANVFQRMCPSEVTLKHPGIHLADIFT